jgi:hypothetical protein
MLDEGLSIEWIRRFKADIQRAPIVMLDGNLSARVLQEVCQLAAAANVPVWFEPVSRPS